MCLARYMFEKYASITTVTDAKRLHTLFLIADIVHRCDMVIDYNGQSLWQLKLAMWNLAIRVKSMGHVQCYDKGLTFEIECMGKEAGVERSCMCKPWILQATWIIVGKFLKITLFCHGNWIS